MGNYIDPSDITNWPSGCTDTEGSGEAISCQAEWIAFAEETIEKIVGTWFYEKAFDIEINGNNKNRLNVPLYADIITVTHIYICNIELDPAWYSYDENSVFLDLCGSGIASGSGAELYWILSQHAEAGLFPRGHNNIRIIGTAGQVNHPVMVKKAVLWLVEAINDGVMDTAVIGIFKSEKIGDYSYTKGLTGYAKSGVFTGIGKVDAIIRHLMKQKKPVIMAP